MLAGQPGLPSIDRLFSTAHDAVVVAEAASGRIVFWNPAAEALFGYSAAEAAGLSIEALVPESLFSSHREGIAHLGATGRDAPVDAGAPLEVPARRKDGRELTIEMTLSPLELGPDGGRHVLALIRDGSARARALEQRVQELLSESEQRFRATFEQAAVGIAQVSPEGRWLQVNQRVCDILGYSRDELLAKDFRELTHPDDLPATLEQVERLLRGEVRTFSLEKRYLRRDGTPVWVNLTASLVRGPQGEPRYFIGVIEDVDTHRHAEEEVRRLNQELEQRVQERTAQALAVIQDLKQQIQERKRAEDALRELALFDRVTGLPNRTLLLDRLQQALATASRQRLGLALLMMDLDRFKEVNDTLGHHVGDVLLQQVGQRLQSALRASDTIARLGGDEFAVVLPATDENGARQAAQKLLDALETPFLIEQHSLTIGASVGVAEYPEHGGDGETLLRHADAAMYVAKRGGGGYALYTPQQEQQASGQLDVAAELRRGIEQDELVLHFQPLVRLGAGRVVGMEALVRWQHPSRGVLPPDQFIPLAERTGLIRPLGRWVLDAALRQLRHWHEAGLDLSVAVNLSMRNLHDPALPSTVTALLEQWQIEPARLQLEITESVVMADPVATRELLGRLRELGVQVVLDDFGTGYSSLSYLAQLPADAFKIDRSFMRDLSANASSTAVVRTAVDLGRQRNLTIVAEGIEDEATWDLLALLGCDVGQGFFLGRPMPAVDVPAWLHAWRVRLERRLAGAAGVLAALARAELFRLLPSEALERLAKFGRQVSFPAGSVLIQRGDVEAVLYLLIRGRVVVERGEEAADEQLHLAELGSGEVVGEMGALDGRPRSATVRALEDIEAIALNAVALGVVLLQHPELAAGLLRVLSARLRSTDALLELVAHQDPEQATSG